MKRKDEKDLYRNLLDGGVSQTEIESVYQKLRTKGYGEAAAIHRMEEAMGRMGSTSRTGAIRRGSRQPSIEEVERQLPEDSIPDIGATHAPAVAAARRQAVRIPGSLRRRINAWSFRHGLLIVGFPQRWNDFLAWFRPSIPDRVHPRLIRALTEPHILTQISAHEFSLIDSISALRRSARHLLGELGTGGHEAVIQAYRRRDPFALDYLSRFNDPHKRLTASLARLEAASLEGITPEAIELVRPTRELYRLVLTTEQVSLKRVGELLAVGREIVSAYTRPSAIGDLETSCALFIDSLDRLQRFKRELYPVVLRAIGRFYEDFDTTEQKRELIYSFAGITEDDILTTRRFTENETRAREQRMIEEKKREVEELELEKNAGFSRRFHGALSLLDTLFPESGIDQIEQNHYLLPYFSTRVFSRSLPLDERGGDIESLAADDPLQPVMILHRVIDNLISSISENNLERLVNHEGVAQTLASIRTRWAHVYQSIFSPYVRAVTAFSRGLDEKDSYASTFRESTLGRSLSNEIIGYRTTVFSSNPDASLAGAHPPPLSSLVAELHSLLSELGQDITQDVVKRDDPIAVRIYAELAGRPFVDFERHGSVQSPEVKPATRQLKRYVEAKYYSTVKEIPKLSQLFFFDAMRGVVDLYRFLLADKQSFLRHRGSSITVAGASERAAWTKEHTERTRDSVELLRARLAENEATAYIDELTGLKNKNFFLKELPRQFEDLRKKKRPFCFLLLDLDHFKWVNDELGHQKGDEVLRESSAALLDGIRLGHDIGIRYGGEEILLVIQAPLHNAVLLAERLRHAQQERVATADHWTAIRELADSRGEPCTTFSIGVIQADGAPSMDEAMKVADRALYAAKATRNTVVLTDPAGGGDVGEPPVITYDQYVCTIVTATKLGETESG